MGYKKIIILLIQDMVVNKHIKKYVQDLVENIEMRNEYQKKRKMFRGHPGETCV